MTNTYIAPITENDIIRRPSTSKYAGVNIFFSVIGSFSYKGWTHSRARAQTHIGREREGGEGIYGA